MKTSYISFQPHVRLGNHLYYVLQAYKRSTEDTKFIHCVKQHNDVWEKEVYDVLIHLNVNELITDKNDNCQHFHGKDFQFMGKDFTFEQLESLIKQYIIKAEVFTNYKVTEEKEKCLLLNIRNGDYLLPVFSNLNCFNRKDYIEKAINHSQFKNFEQIHVFSDDLDLCKQLYHQMLSKRFKEVKYITHGSILNDFVEISFYKNKIIWNSTFSFWASFIGGIIYDHKDIVVCPNRFLTTIDMSSVGSPYWIQIPTI